MRFRKFRGLFQDGSTGSALRVALEMRENRETRSGEDFVVLITPGFLATMKARELFNASRFQMKGSLL
jgi:hypothetical protein